MVRVFHSLVLVFFVTTILTTSVVTHQRHMGDVDGSAGVDVYGFAGFESGTEQTGNADSTQKQDCKSLHCSFHPVIFVASAVMNVSVDGDSYPVFSDAPESDLFLRKRKKPPRTFS